MIDYRPSSNHRRAEQAKWIGKTCTRSVRTFPEQTFNSKISIMIKSFISITVFVTVISFAWSSFAHEGHSHDTPGASTTAHNRLWFNKDFSASVRGLFVAVKGDLVQIRTPDNTLVSLKLAELSAPSQRWVEDRMVEIRRTNLLDPDKHQPLVIETMRTAQQPSILLAQFDESKANIASGKTPEMAKAFAAFVELKAIQSRWDNRFFYVESKGIPGHRMMVGITAWQQQVPLPQSYFGENAWRIPLHPVPAKNPMTAKNNFLRGAIALAANGVPIFNPLNNRGDDAYLFGELDEFGGHCGRADDYHYHLAPVHLQSQVGKGLPIAYALDGYPIYGYEEPDGSEVKGLDSFNGHEDAKGQYHYHATKKYPYLNGGFHGEVTQRDGQVDPQPRANSIRPAGEPLRGAKVTDFTETKPGSFRLTYEWQSKKNSISYTLSDNGSVDFSFVDANGKTVSQNYSANRRGQGDRGRQPPPARSNEPTSENTQRTEPAQTNRSTSKFVVTSSAFAPNGMIPKEFTCDGASASPPVEWTGAPEGTKSFAISLWHTAPDQEKSYWLVYNIPSNVAKLAKNERNVGTTGLNDKRRATYEPMCSKGPGAKTYHITVYALSAEVKLDRNNPNRANLLTAIKNVTLAEAMLDFQYERKK